MLRGVLGDEVFFAGVDAYYDSEHKFGSATTEDFRDVFEASSGVELDWFFEDWIYGEYRPNYRYVSYQEPDGEGGYWLYMRIQQTQTTTPTVFRMPVDVHLGHSGGAIDTVTFQINSRKEPVKFHMDAAAVSTSFDPDNWVMKYSSPMGWFLFMITTDEDFGEGTQFAPYEVVLDARGGTSSYSYSLIGGQLPTGYSLATGGTISGVTPDTGWFAFTVRCDDNGNSYYDEVEFDLYVNPSEGLPGDIDVSGEVNVADLTYLVNYLFGGGPAPAIPAQADVNASCAIDVADLTYIVDFLFGGGPAPVMGCAK
jgi:hypothetical protein